MSPVPIASSLLRQEAERLKSLGALGRSPVIRRLFDYLVERAEEGSPPKELEIAAAVFDRGGDFDPGTDASVRVYAHKLRQRLDAAYRDAPAESGRRLALPRGEYRLVLADPVAEGSGEPDADAAVEDVPPQARPAATRRSLLAGLGVGALAGAGAAWAALKLLDGPRLGPLQAAAKRPFWSSIMGDSRPLVLALGDYYILGESPNGMDVSRLVREYAINSKDDLDQYLMSHPDMMGRLVDLDLRYLPIGAGPAVARVAALAALAGRERTSRVILMSELTPAMLSTSNVIYMGYFSGMDWFRGYALAGSRFRMGEDQDQLTDSRTGVRYISQGGAGDIPNKTYHDFAYVSGFQHPAGGRVVVLAGTRDAGLIHAAATATSPQGLDQIAHSAGASRDLEALFEVTALHRTSVGGRLVAASPLNHPNGEPPHRALPG